MLAILSLCIIIPLGACQRPITDTSDAPLIAPVQPEKSTPSPTPKPTFTITPIVTPTLSPTPAPTPEILNVRDFLSENAHFITFEQTNLLKNKVEELKSYMEFSQTQKNSLRVQYRILSNINAPIIKVFECDDNQLRIVYEKSKIGYTYSRLNEKNSDEILLKAPVAIGTSWEVKEGISKIVSLDTIITTPLETLVTVEVNTQFNDGSSRKQYFLKDIGLIAEYNFDKDNVPTQSFIASGFEEDHAFDQTVRFYYADESDNTVKYISRVISIKPNTDLRKVFAEKLSLPPSKSSLFGLTSSVKIRSIRLSKNTVTVDFSSELVTQMDLTRFQERALQEALADTFTEYFQCKRFIMLVDGKSYESRHMFMMEGEAVPHDPKNAKKYS